MPAVGLEGGEGLSWMALRQFETSTQDVKFELIHFLLSVAVARIYVPRQCRYPNL